MLEVVPVAGKVSCWTPVASGKKGCQAKLWLRLCSNMVPSIISSLISSLILFMPVIPSLPLLSHSANLYSRSTFTIHQTCLLFKHVASILLLTFSLNVLSVIYLFYANDFFLQFPANLSSFYICAQLRHSAHQGIFQKKCLKAYYFLLSFMRIYCKCKNNWCYRTV